MYSLGFNLKQKNDKLQRCELSQIFEMLTNPKQQTIDFLNHLHILYEIDPNAYRMQKTNLPYIVPSLFNPPFRRSENFGSSEHLIIDFDHLSTYDLTPQNLKENLKTDENVELMFISPSADGLKVLLPLKKPIYDLGKYKLIYQSFISKFELHHNLPLIADYATSDVTRACFLSIDNNAYFNSNAEPVDVESFVDFENLSQVHYLQKLLESESTEIEHVAHTPDKETFTEIKKLLNPNFAKKQLREKQIFVPQELNEIIGKLADYLADFKIIAENFVNINYGKKVIVNYENHKAEVNVFFGHRGFSVVRSPKTGTNLELMELTFQIINQFFLEKI